MDPQAGEVISDNADGIARWLIDRDYNEESFFVGDGSRYQPPGGRIHQVFRGNI
jgi:hypothetical protein